MASFHRAGWRQGSLLRYTLPLDIVDAGTGGRGDRAGRARQLLPSSAWRVSLGLARVLAHACGATIVPNQPGVIVRRQGTHSHWLVVTQNCDLDRLDENDRQPVVELRPVFDQNPPSELGLRSRQLLLDDSNYIEAQSGRTMVSPAALTVAVESGGARSLVSDDRRLALTIWLGLRYDRPAVPDELGPLARAIADKVRGKKQRALARRVRDVLAQFQPGDPTRYSLYAIVADDSDRLEVSLWLSNLALSIPTSLGVSDQLEAVTAGEVSLTLIESSYSVDASDVTWKGRSLEGLYPDGAY